MKYNYGASSPNTTWDRDCKNELQNGPKSLQILDYEANNRRCRTPKSAPNSRPQSSTRSSSATRPRRSLSQHPNRKDRRLVSIKNREK